jgi:hypothetical protein
LLWFAAARLAGLACVTGWAWRIGRQPHDVLGLGWDARWYWRIAEYGYGTVIPSASQQGQFYNDLAFFPLYPALIRSVSTITPLDAVSAALLLSWTGAVLAAWGVYAVGELLHGRRTGIALVVLWGLLPHSVVLTMAYTEPLMTAFAAWALYAALTRRWLYAGGLAALAGLTRPSGFAVAAAVIVAATVAVGRCHWIRTDRDERSGAEPSHLSARSDGQPGGNRPRHKGRWLPWAGAAVAPMGWLGYVAWVGRQTGTPFGYFAVQERWGSRFDFGLEALNFTEHLILGSGRSPYYLTVAILVAAVVLLVLCVLDRQPLPLLVYSGVLLVVALGGTEYFQCKPRFLLPAFPLLFPAAAALARARPRTAAVAVVTLTGLSLCFGTYLVTVSPMAL